MPGSKIARYRLLTQFFLLWGFVSFKVKRCVGVANVSGDLVSALSAGHHIVYPAFV